MVYKKFYKITPLFFLQHPTIRLMQHTQDLRHAALSKRLSSFFIFKHKCWFVYRPFKNYLIFLYVKNLIKSILIKNGGIMVVNLN